MLDKFLTFLQKEAVLCISCLCACISLVLKGDLQGIPECIDWRVIILLFCLMASVAGLKNNGVFTHIACMITKGKHQKRSICFILIAASFFLSMLITNDVALLTIIPITILALEKSGWSQSLSLVIVLQAIAANLGGMITPIGNPQNLFIFTTYDLGLFDFFSHYFISEYLLLCFLHYHASFLGRRSQMSKLIFKKHRGRRQKSLSIPFCLLQAF